jgi:hypothetical protein
VQNIPLVLFLGTFLFRSRFTLQIATTLPICHPLCFDLFKLANQNP